MAFPSSRTLNTLSLISIVIIFAIIFYVEYVDGAIPCPLCMVQRAALIGFGAVIIVAGMHSPKRWGIYVYGALMLLFSISGMLTAVRQLWIQSLPASQAPTTCGVDIYYLLQMLPFDKALMQIFNGTAECAQVTWSFLGLSMAAWSFISFVVFALLALRQFIRQ